jgi:hypothetical protein
MPEHGSFPALLVPPLVAAYGCVPETDQIAPIALAAAVVATVEAITRHRVHLLVDAVLAALALWAVFHGVSGRSSAFVGAAFAWWPVVLLPVVALLRPVAMVDVAAWRRWLIVGIGTGAAITVARTGALEPTVGPALTAVALAAPVSLAVALGIAGLGARRGPSIASPLDFKRD